MATLYLMRHGAACAGVLRKLDYDWRRDGKRLGNCCIIVLDFDPEAGFSVRDLINPND